MYVISKAKQQIINELKKAIGSGYTPSIGDLSIPSDKEKGDMAFPCFVLAKKLNKNPVELATEIAVKIGPKEYVSKIQSDGPYVNFTFSNDVFGLEVIEEINEKTKKNYGQSNSGKDKKIMVEYANLNTHKDVHVGHLRNLFVGQMLVNVLQENNYDVIPVAYINDLGAHVAKSVWAMQRFHKDEDIEKGKEIDFLRSIYVESSEMIEENEIYKEEVAEVFRNLEKQKGNDVSAWKKSRKWSLDYLQWVYDDLGLDIEKWYFESDLILKSKKIIDDLIEQGLVVKSEGAWIVDLEAEKLGVNLLVKSDGTLLYNAKDIGLAMKKESDYHPQRSIYVVDNRQSHALKQLFMTLKKMNFEKEMVHLAYDFVTLKDGAMASRKGNVVRYELFKDAMVEKAKKETKIRHEDWSEKHINKVSHAIAFSAMRFGILKQDLDKKIVFDFDEAMSFDGFTGPYLLYTNARINSVLKKAKKFKIKSETDLLKTNTEHQLIILLAQYPDVVFNVSNKFNLSTLAKYLFELAKRFSEFYGQESILKADDDLRAQRLGLITAVQQVLQNGLRLMSIEVIDEM